MPMRKDDFEIGDLLTTVKKGMPAAPGNMSAQEFSLFCENIVDAIVKAIDMYDRSAKSVDADFGEEERVVEE